MRQVADVRARALDDVLVGLEQRVQLLLQRLDLVGQVDIEPRRLAGADGGQALLHLGQRQQAEADLEQRRGEQADAGQRQGQRETGTEVVKAGIHLAQRAGDGDRVALCLLALAEDIDGLGDAQPLLQRPIEAGPAHLALVGLDALLARQRNGESRERARGEQMAWLAVERLDLPIPARMRDLEQRLADILGDAGLVVAVIDGVGEHDVQQTRRGAASKLFSTS